MVELLKQTITLLVQALNDGYMVRSLASEWATLYWTILRASDKHPALEEAIRKKVESR